MTDTQKKCFFALAEYLNYTRAAQSLNISQSTLSTNIAALEKSLGLCLFIRNRRMVNLSPEGEIMLEAMKKSDRIFSAAVARAKEFETENILKIGIMEGLNTQILRTAYIRAFREKHPEIMIDFKSFGNSLLLEKCDAGEVDAVLGNDILLKNRKDMGGIPIFVSPLYLVKTKDRDEEHLLKNPDKLPQEHFILQERIQDPFADRYFDAFCQKYKVNPGARQIIRVSNTASVMMNIEMGRGVGFADGLSIIFQTPDFSFEEIAGIRVEYDLIYKSGRKKKSLRFLIQEILERNGKQPE